MTIELTAEKVGVNIEYFDPETDDVHFRVNIKDVVDFASGLNTDGDFEDDFFEERDECEFSYSKCQVFQKHQSDEDYLEDNFEEVTQLFLTEKIFKNL